MNAVSMRINTVLQEVNEQCELRLCDHDTISGVSKSLIKDL